MFKLLREERENRKCKITGKGQGYMPMKFINVNYIVRCSWQVALKLTIMPMRPCYTGLTGTNCSSFCISNS